MSMLFAGHSSGGAEDSSPDAEGGTQRKYRSLREKSLFIGLSVSGTARVSGAHGGWDVYVPSPLLPPPPPTSHLPADVLMRPGTRHTASPRRRGSSLSTKSTASSPHRRRPCSTRSAPPSRSSGSRAGTIPRCRVRRVRRARSLYPYPYPRESSCHEECGSVG